MNKLRLSFGLILGMMFTYFFIFFLGTGCFDSDYINLVMSGISFLGILGVTRWITLSAIDDILEELEFRFIEDNSMNLKIVEHNIVTRVTEINEETAKRVTDEFLEIADSRYTKKRVTKKKPVKKESTK